LAPKLKSLFFCGNFPFLVEIGSSFFSATSGPHPEILVLFQIFTFNIEAAKKLGSY